MRASLLLLVLATGLNGAISDERLRGIFSPLTIENAALSPDGKRVAFTSREGDKIYVLAAEIDKPDHATVRALAITDERAEGYMEREDRKQPGRVVWMSWVSDRRLALCTNVQFLMMRGKSQGALYVFDADGQHARTILSAREGRGGLRVFSLNPAAPHEVFAIFDGDLLLVDTATGKRRVITNQQASEIVSSFKAAAKTREAEFTATRQRFDALLPGYRLQGVEDPRSNSRQLVLAECIADPGGFLIHEPATNRVWDFLRRAPEHDAHAALRTEPFSFSPADSPPISGLLVYPALPKIKRAPLVIWINDRVGLASREYRPEIQGLAEFGFAVAVIDEPKSRAPSAQAAHIARAVDELATRFPVSRRSVALAGEYAGARRALELAEHGQGRFRCAVAILPRPDTTATNSYTARFGFALQPAPPTQPFQAALICSWPGPPPSATPDFRAAAEGEPPLEFPAHQAARHAAVFLEHQQVAVRFRTEPPELQSRRPAALAATFREVESFLNEQLY